ncbi:hypothetical protein BsWGS_02175 [Bradybaena similaris]
MTLETATDISVGSASTSDMQVKEEPEDTEYEQTSAASCLISQKFTPISRNSSEDHSPSFTHNSASSVNQLDTTKNHSSQKPKNNIFAGSTIRSQLHGAVASNKIDTVQNIVENLLKKNETLLAMSDAGGFKPNARRVRAAHDGYVKRMEPAFPSGGQASVFPVSHSLLAHVNTSKGTSDTQKHHLIRPKSPTRRYDGMLKDKTHFTYALMESSAADHEIEKIFNVQNHELVCAIGSKTLIADSVNKVVASLEFCYFWCNFCPFTTNSKSLLTQHMLEHRFCCKYCAYESFCRSDVVRHMHKMHNDFKDTANNLYYLTLLSDYLRVKSKKDEKENKNPDEDVNNIEQEEIDPPLLNPEGPKRKSVLEKDDCVQIVNKVRKINKGNGAEDSVEKSSAIAQERPETLRQNHSLYHCQPHAEADYDVFDMEVEDVSDSQIHLTTDESTAKKCASFTTTTSDKQTSIAGKVHIGPHIQDKCLQNFTTTCDPGSSEICNVQQLHGLYQKSCPEIGTSSLYWSCGYCTFQGSSQTEVKDHNSRLHPGKPQRYVALLKNIASNSLVSKNMKGNMSGSSTSTSSSMNTKQSHVVNNLNTNVADLFLISSDSKSDDATSSNNDTMLLSENGGSSSLLKVKMNSTLAKKGITVVKCFHCFYTSRRHWTMKNHIYHKHRALGLVAVVNESPFRQIFFCARDDCTFRSEDATVYLNHVDECTPWNKPELADVEVEPHIRECLRQTVALAEVSKLKEIEHTKSRLSKDICNIEDMTESIHNKQLLLEGKPSLGTSPLLIESKSVVNSRDETPVAEVVTNTVDLCKVVGSDTSENACNLVSPHNLNSSLEFEHCSNKTLPSKDFSDLQTPAHLQNKMADKLDVNNSQASSLVDLSKYNSAVSTSAASKDQFVSDNFVDVGAGKVTCLGEHSSKFGRVLTEQSESDLAVVITENSAAAYNCSVNEVGLLSQTVLSTENIDSVLSIENNGTESEMQQNVHTDQPVFQLMKCKDSNSFVDLDKKHTAKDLKHSKNKLKLAVRKKKDTSFMKSNVADKHDNPSLKIKFKMVGCGAVYDLSRKTRQPEADNTNRKIRTADSNSCDSSSCSSYSNEGINSSTQNDCTEASKMQNPWLKDLMDSTEDSDSDQTSQSSDIHDSVNSVSDGYSSQEYISDKSSFFVSNTSKGNGTSNNFQEKTSLPIEASCNECITSGGLLTDKSKPAENVNKSHYSFVPLRSAAVKAISKMKPVLSCETVNTGSKSRNNCRRKKSALKHQLSSPYLNTKNHKLSNNRKCKILSGHKFASKVSKSVYMCQYCIDISEGPLEKIKSHVLSKHSSMPPMVINCFKQRHHISCQFYICPYDLCYKLSSTQEELDTHKSTHEKETLQKSSPELFESKASLPANISQKVKKSTIKPVRACRVKLNVLDMSKINSVGSVQIMAEKKKFQCLYCTSYYYDETLQGMKAHYFQEHEGQLIVIRDTEAHRLQLPSRIYVCDNPNCQHSYTNRLDLDSHARSHKSNLTFIYECASCGWYSASHTAACYHVKNEHADEKAVSLVHMQVSVDEYGQTSKIIL